MKETLLREDGMCITHTDTVEGLIEHLKDLPNKKVHVITFAFYDDKPDSIQGMCVYKSEGVK